MRLSRLGSISNQLRSANMNELSDAPRLIQDELEEQRILVLATARKAGVKPDDLAPIIKRFQPYPEGEHGDRSRGDMASRLMDEVNK